MKTALIFLALLFTASCGNDDRIHKALDSVGIPKHLAELKYTVTTPGGVRVLSTQPIPDAALATIDAAISLQIARISAARPAWTAHTRLDQYSVMLIDTETYSTVDMPGAPLIQLRGGTTAGTVVGILGTRQTLGRSYIVVPHQNGQNWRFMDYFFQAVRNESEHDRECNEPNRLEPYAECEQYTGWNDVHPHFP